ncbi:hypothetical protein Q3A66_17660 [Hymenobacter sp. BT770]|uniref:hypothetical protein n=1 Tax=Hymenobacter sp. BT770 TaxID=2886942 RepID=UPI001D10D269|nr:hypothetical protein [Hymenobacter sp. BT770]MCC3153765.1 hypothetical protein [Hymenobacter sp. BT770]MDO3416899.1 hypothetical protein [Hymenobacter sp. BT770]
MKKIFLLAPLVLFLAVVGCKKLDQLLTFNVDVSQSVTIPGYFVGAQLAPVKVVTKSEESFRNNKTTRDNVKNVYLNKMVLTVTSPSGSTFDFLDKIDIYINTPNANNKIKLAYLYTVPQGTNTITLIPTTDKLDEYLKSDTYELTVDAKLTGFSANDFTVRSDATFKVTADPL